MNQEQHHNETTSLQRKVEDLEQMLIQHLRTAGIRKPRETALIDEVMELRKQRRRLIFLINAEVTSLQQQKQELEEALQTARKSNDNEQQQIREKLHRSEVEHSMTIQNLKESATKEAQLLKERYKFEEKIRAEKLRKKCEERIKQVEEKLNEVLIEKRRGDLKDAQVIAVDLVHKAQVELEKKNQKKMMEYRQALDGLKGREQDLLGSLERYKNLAEGYGTENHRLQRKVAALDEREVQLAVRERELEQQRELHEQRCTSLSRENLELHEKVSIIEKEKANALNEKDKIHATQLARVDERVRKMLEARDNEIHRLQLQLSKAQSQNKLAESMLQNLNKEFVPVKKR